VVGTGSYVPAAPGATCRATATATSAAGGHTPALRRIPSGVLWRRRASWRRHCRRIVEAPPSARHVERLGRAARRSGALNRGHGSAGFGALSACRLFRSAPFVAVVQTAEPAV